MARSGRMCLGFGDSRPIRNVYMGIVISAIYYYIFCCKKSRAVGGALMQGLFRKRAGPYLGSGNTQSCEAMLLSDSGGLAYFF